MDFFVWHNGSESVYHVIVGIRAYSRTVARFSDKHVAENFSNWLKTVDRLDDLMCAFRANTILPPDLQAIFSMIEQRSQHVTRV